jgi:hypothetical protein
MNDLQEELQTEINEERKLKKIYRLLPYIISLALAIVLITGIYNLHQYRKQNQTSKLGDLLINSLDRYSEQPQLSMDSFNYIAESSYNISKIAGLIKSAINMKEGKKSRGLDSYKNLIDSDNKGTAFSEDLAKLNWSAYKLEQQHLGENEIDLIKRYMEEASLDSSPFKLNAKLLKAQAHIKNEEYEPASEILTDLEQNQKPGGYISHMAAAILHSHKNLKAK